MRDNTAGQFTWINSGDLPHIAQLQPGTAPEKSSTKSTQHYRGKGDFLTLVSPMARKARRTSFGVIIGNSEHILVSDKPFEHADKQLAFRGKVGYARKGELALFEGTEFRLGKFSIAREGGDFGLSTAIKGRRITGHVSVRSGGRIKIIPPVTFNPKRVKATLAGRALQVMVKDGTIHFTVELKQADGRREFAIEW